MIANAKISFGGKVIFDVEDIWSIDESELTLNRSVKGTGTKEINYLSKTT